jgi:hypothetical protein
MSRQKRKLVMTLAALGAYLISYAVLSNCGGYRLIMFGRPNPPFLGSSDFVWQPRFGECYQWGEGYHVDILGACYFPLIYVDQKLVHKSWPYITVTDAHMNIETHGSPPVEQMHPVARRAIAIVDAARARHQAELDAAQARKDSAEVSRIKKLIQDEAKKELGVKR